MEHKPSNYFGLSDLPIEMWLEIIRYATWRAGMSIYLSCKYSHYSLCRYFKHPKLKISRYDSRSGTYPNPVSILIKNGRVYYHDTFARVDRTFNTMADIMKFSAGLELAVHPPCGTITTAQTDRFKYSCLIKENDSDIEVSFKEEPVPERVFKFALDFLQVIQNSIPPKASSERIIISMGEEDRKTAVNSNIRHSNKKRRRAYNSFSFKFFLDADGNFEWTAPNYDFKTIYTQKVYEDLKEIIMSDKKHLRPLEIPKYERSYWNKYHAASFEAKFIDKNGKECGLHRFILHEDGKRIFDGQNYKEKNFKAILKIMDRVLDKSSATKPWFIRLSNDRGRKTLPCQSENRKSHMEDDKKIYYDDGVPLDIKRQIIAYCSPSTTDLLRSVSRSWFKAINKTTFTIRNSLIYVYFSPLRKYSTSLSIDMVHPPGDLTPTFRSIAEQLNTHLVSLKLGEKFDIHYNSIDFNHLRVLTNLTELDLSLHQIDLAFISHLPLLKKLHLRKMRTALSLHDPLSSTVLEDLALESCLCESDLLASITNPSRLTKLELHGRYPVHQIKQFTNVKDLHIINNNHYTDDIKVDINAFPFLESLQTYSSIFSCNLLDLTKLTKLVIHNQLYAGLKLPMIGHLTNLKVLTLYYGVDEYNKSLEFFSKLTKLEELDLSNIFEREDLGYLEHLNCPNLTKMFAYINIEEEENNNYLNHLTKLAPSLLSLELVLYCHTEHVTALTSLTNLTHLTATFSSSNSEILKCQLSTKLKTLKLNTGGEVHFNLKFPNLEKLSISGIEFSDEDAQYLSSTLQQLTYDSQSQPITASFAYLTKVTCLKVKNTFMDPEDFANIVQLVNLKKLISQSQLTPDQLSQLTSLQCYTHKKGY